MRALMTQAFARGASAVAAGWLGPAGSISEPLREAVDVLDGEPRAIVLGPAADGGYYLVGATSVPDVFTGIDWGGPDVLRADRSRREPGRG